jgi:hypothetical protein
MNKIQISVDTTPGTTKDVTLTCGDQKVTLDIPDQVFYGVDGRIPDPRYILRDICAHLAIALAKLEVTSTYVPQSEPPPPNTDTFVIPVGLGKAK